MRNGHKIKKKWPPPREFRYQIRSLENGPRKINCFEELIGTRNFRSILDFGSNNVFKIENVGHVIFRW